MFERIREKNLHTWLGGYLRHLAAGVLAPRVDGPRHLLFAICDHYEPLWQGPAPNVADGRVLAWEQRYAAVVDGFRDADGRPPRHTFFFPAEEYRPSFLDRLARLARAGYGEVEVHLHHDHDTEEGMRRTLDEFLGRLASHGHLARDPDGRLRYAFIHGNWALANARADGRWCGVDAELPLLFATGCYADFTFPAAPSECQPGIVNQIYWPTGDLGRRRAYERGRRARVGDDVRDRILFIEGPLSLARRPGRPIAIENGDLMGHDFGTPERVASWAAQNIHVAGRPEWVFVKVHTHGAQEKNAAAFLDEPARLLHGELTTRYNDGERWMLHYVTAREMYNVARAAIDGKSGDPGDYRNYVLAKPPVAG